MPRLGAAIFLALLLSPLPVHADVWRCLQDGGPDLFTDTLKDPANCKPYVPQVEFSYASAAVSSTQPTVEPSQPIPMEKPSAPPETRREDTEPYTPPYDDQEPFYYTYPYYYPDWYWFPFISGHPRHHHGHHHGRSSSHGAGGHSSGHGGSHGGHR